MTSSTRRCSLCGKIHRYAVKCPMEQRLEPTKRKENKRPKPKQRVRGLLW